ncbi:MAG TPA: YceI family protein, partial [bacterium]|nr:YceI family protein [bacterium]
MIVLMIGLFAFGARSAQEYTIDAAHSEVGFSVKHMVVATVRGNFTEFSGKIMYDENDISNSSVEGVIKTASINTGNSKRDEHLRNSDFFDAANHPEILFKTKKVEKKGDGFVAIGDLTMRGVTKEVALDFEITGKITDPWGNERVGLEARGVINRQDFGISWNNALDNGGVVVSNEV